MEKLRIFTMILILCVLGGFTSSSAQESVRAEVKRSSLPADLTATKKQLETCVVSTKPGANSFERCGDLSSTAVSSQGVQVVLTGGKGNYCTSVSLDNGDSISSCLVNGISVVQVCRQKTEKSAKQSSTIKKTEFKCEEFFNGEKQVQ